MELLLDADPVIRETMPLLLDSAGLPEHSRRLREAKPLLTLEAAFEVAEILRDLHSGLARPSFEWLDVVMESAFWAEGAVLAAADGEIDLFDVCLRMCRRVVAEGWAQFAIH